MTKGVVLLGPEGAGKTSLLYRLGQLKTPIRKTRVPDFVQLKTPNQNQNQPGEDKRLCVWDIPTVDESFVQVFVQKAKLDTVVLVYDCSDRNSLQKLSRWVRFARQMIPNAYFVVVGTKKDQERQVFEADIEAFRTKNGLQDVDFFSTSMSENDEGVALLRAKLDTLAQSQPHPQVQMRQAMIKRIEHYQKQLSQIWEECLDACKWEDSQLYATSLKLCELFKSDYVPWSIENKKEWESIYKDLNQELNHFSTLHAKSHRVEQIAKSVVLVIGAMLLSCTLVGLFVTLPDFIKNYKKTGNVFRFHRTPEEHARDIYLKIDAELEKIKPTTQKKKLELAKGKDIQHKR